MAGHEELISSELIEFAETRRFHALYDDQSQKQLELLALEARTYQAYTEHPIYGKQPQGPPRHETQIIGMDLRDGQWVDVADDPGFLRIVALA